MSDWLSRVHLVDVIAIGAVVYVAWTRAVVPMWRAMRWSVREADDRATLKAIAADLEDQPTREILLEIASHFRPDAGHSLRDVVDGIRAEQAQLRDKVENVERLVRTFLLDRRRGGQRHYDPQHGGGD